MDDRLTGFYGSLKGRRIAMLGLGMSNAPLIFQFLEKGAVVTARDRRSREELGELAGRLEAAGARLLLGDGYLAELDEEIVFRTPGMKYNLPQLDEARRRGVAVTSEMEVFFDLCPCKTIAVTGSDGKTTTTTVISEMLASQGLTVHLGGNIGHPLLPEIANIAPGDMAVVELSSFQLISMRRSPDIAVVTNVSPNHLDIHKDMQEYISAKRNVFLHQNAFGRAAFNLDNDITASFVPEARGQCFVFSRRRPVEYGAYLEGGVLRFNDGMRVHDVMEARDIRIPGMHNVENYLAAISALWGVVSSENMRKVARSFAGVEHRNELVRELGGVKYYNDSIATSPTRTIAGLDSFDRSVILIAGGYDKHIPFDVLGPKVVEKVKRLILLGKTADKIEEAVRAAQGFDAEKLPVVKVATLEDAVADARGHAAPGDIVTLSPACATFDGFRNFEERGRIFKEIVCGLR
ncbi:MAG: UDP-N-acetylmuramoyl-L-alanine--D-glutamate ligase [Clostridia bacterium]|nr:UDP-N-acetylmuramoyl-L-alanine--D-glutamate ligase [Clostridia bacterium]